MNNRSRRWLLTFCCLSVIVMALAAYKYFEIKEAIKIGQTLPERSETVTASTATLGVFVSSTTVLGEVVSPQSLALRNELEGRITEIHFSSGEKVFKDQILIQLDISDESARLQAAEARETLAQLDLERFKSLYKQKTVSKQVVDKAQAEHLITQADINALKAAIEKKTLRAPFDAIAGLHSFEPGEYIQANTHIVDLVGTVDYTWVDFNLPMGQAFIDVGQEVEVIPPTRGTPSLKGEVIARNTKASANSRNLRYRAQVKIESPIPANTVVKLTVPLESVNTVLIPISALLKDSSGDYVYVLLAEPSSKNYRAHRRTVVIGERNATTAAISSGLEAGELIADSGNFKLNPGLLTIVREPTTPPAAINPAAEP